MILIALLLTPTILPLFYIYTIYILVFYIKEERYFLIYKYNIREGDNILYYTIKYYSIKYKDIQVWIDSQVYYYLRTDSQVVEGAVLEIR